MPNPFKKLLQTEIENSIWTGYVTYYPHKKAYKALDLIIKDIWKEEENELNLYVHIPFCDNKCSYCNLFSTVLKQEEKEVVYEKYVDKVLEEIDYCSKHINKNVKILSLYFGGGTPIVLKLEQIEKIINKFRSIFLNWDENVEICIECAPDRLNYQYLKGLKKLGIKRLSIGVQSFVQSELAAVNRNMIINNLHNTINDLKNLGFNFNLDLIYGLPYQTDATIFDNIEKAISYSPDSICIYPLAIRKHTGMDKVDISKTYSNGKKYQLYDAIREKLEQGGYRCETVVRYVKSNTSTYQQQRLEYQGVPTLGIGAGARSYNDKYSYSITYKVQDRFVRTIIEQYLLAPVSQFKYDGFCYNIDEQKRKFVMLTLLDPALFVKQYEQKFKCKFLDDFKQEIEALLQLELIEHSDELGAYLLTKKGRKYCDIAVDIFTSEKVRKLYANYIVE